VSLRRALFQVHLWTGVAIGIYVFLISLSGSAIVFRREMDKLFCPRIVLVSPVGTPLSDAQLQAHARTAYPRFEIERVDVRGPRVPGAATEIRLVGANATLERLFDPYTGENLGDTIACEPPFVTALADFHDRLAGGRTGLLVNGIGAIAVTLMCVTGAVIWWPGGKHWWRRVTVRRGVGWRRFLWDLHNMLGFWLFFFIVMWAVTAIYFAFPDAFNTLSELFQDGEAESSTSIFLQDAFAWMTRLHFGRTFGASIKISWAILGLMVCALSVTGLVMWWNRHRRRPDVRGTNATFAR
jgi:uncharacterized iron-regulated membrane protein